MFPGRGVGLLGRHHEDVGAGGPAGIQVALAGDDVDGVTEVLEALPLGLLLGGERAERRDEKRRPLVAEGPADGEFGERRLPAGGGRGGDDVVVGVEDGGQRLALHPVELLEPEGVCELGDRLGDFHWAHLRVRAGVGDETKTSVIHEAESSVGKGVSPSGAAARERRTSGTRRG